MGERLKNNNWSFTKNFEGNYSNEHATIAVLQDIRDELQALNRTLSCANFQNIPFTLKDIKKNTTKRKRKKVTHEMPRL